MAIRPIVLVPDPLLKKVCEPVQEFDSQLHELVRDLEDTRRASPGCVGIASPQIGVLQRVAIVDTSQHKKYGDESLGHLVLINPKIVHASGERLGREGCLSLPDFTANVKRAQEIECEYFTVEGERRSLTAREFEAVVIQHEIDHLDGILFLDRVANLSTDVFPRKRSAKPAGR